MSKRQSPLSEFLIHEGRKRYEQRESESLTGNAAADELLYDLRRTPHAFVLGCLMDRQFPAKRCWMIPYRVSQLLGSFSIEKLKEVSPEKMRALFVDNTLHKLNKDMAKVFYLAVRVIDTDYDGNAAKIWLNKPSSATVVRRFRQFHGVGQKISTMAANILVRRFGVPFSDYSAIDISVDVHIERVMQRMGLVPPDAKADIIILKTREMHPQLPGVFDYLSWEIGKDFCHPKNPNCENCPARKPCPKII